MSVHRYEAFLQSAGVLIDTLNIHVVEKAGYIKRHSGYMQHALCISKQGRDAKLDLNLQVTHTHSLEPVPVCKVTLLSV